MTVRTGGPGTVRVERGIRYARAERFRLPVAVPLSDDRLIAVAPQPGLAGSEDCLHLTVFSPARAHAAPVLVWIHGGAHVSGSTADPVTDGARLAATQGVVVVAVQYRLGALGHLFGEGIEGGEDAANAALHDQLAALEWVRAHIQTFGGDAECVTLMGQSAGGVDVLAHLGASAERGLFHRAIAHSCTAERAMTPTRARAVRDALLVEAGVSAPRALVDLTVDALVAAQSRVTDRLSSAAPIDALPFRPVIDGRLLGERPLESIAGGAGSEVPLLIGSMRREALPWMTDAASDDPALMALRRAVAPAASPRELREALPHDRGRWPTAGEVREAVLSEVMYRSPTARVAQARATAGASASTFVFEVDPAGVAGVDEGHSGELPLVFGTTSSTAATHLSQRMMNAWGSFVREGRPSSETAWEDASAGVFAWTREPGMSSAASDLELREVLTSAGADCDRLSPAPPVAFPRSR